MELYIGKNDEEDSYDFGNIVQFYNLDLIQKHVSSKIQVPLSFEEYSQDFMDDLNSIHQQKQKERGKTEEGKETDSRFTNAKYRANQETHDYIYESLCSIYEKEYYKISYEQFITLCNYIITDEVPFQLDGERIKKQIGEGASEVVGVLGEGVSGIRKRVSGVVTRIYNLKNKKSKRQLQELAELETELAESKRQLQELAKSKSQVQEQAELRKLLEKTQHELVVLREKLKETQDKLRMTARPSPGEVATNPAINKKIHESNKKSIQKFRRRLRFKRSLNARHNLRKEIKKIKSIKNKNSYANNLNAIYYIQSLLGELDKTPLSNEKKMNKVLDKIETYLGLPPEKREKFHKDPENPELTEARNKMFQQQDKEERERAETHVPSGDGRPPKGPSGPSFGNPIPSIF